MIKKEKYIHFTSRFYRSNLTSQAFENLVYYIMGVDENVQFEHISETENVSAYTDATFLRDENHNSDIFEKKLNDYIEEIRRELNRLSLLKKDFERYIKV